MRYTFVVEFESTSIEAAENRVANWLQGMSHQGRGTALWYDDPISGNSVLWSEPASTKSALEASRYREPEPVTTKPQERWRCHCGDGTGCRPGHCLNVPA